MNLIIIHFILLELTSIFKNMNYQFKSFRIVKKLFLVLSQEERTEFIEVLNSDLLRCKDDNDLRMYFHIFFDETYCFLELLCKLRIEDLVKHSIQTGKYFKNPFEDDQGCNSEGSLATWATKKVDLFETKDEIFRVLCKKFNSREEEKEYIFQYFSSVIFNSEVELNYNLKDAIHKGLINNDKRFVDNLYEIMELEDENSWKKEFIMDYMKAKEYLEEEFEPLDDLPINL